MTNDPPFHYDIWLGPQAQFGKGPKAIYYVENHNAYPGFDEIALDFELATNFILATFRETQQGNWIGPLAHLGRQTLELLLKSLLYTIRKLDHTVADKALRQHDLNNLWSICIQWMQKSGYDISKDSRYNSTSHFIAAYDAIDPSGDLFRFGLSYKTAFGKQKSYDRVGIEIDIFENEFNDSVGFLRHWDGILFRKHFDANQDE